MRRREEIAGQALDDGDVFGFVVLLELLRRYALLAVDVHKHAVRHCGVYKSLVCQWLGSETRLATGLIVQRMGRGVGTDATSDLMKATLRYLRADQSIFITVTQGTRCIIIEAGRPSREQGGGGVDRGRRYMHAPAIPHQATPCIGLLTGIIGRM